MRSGISQFMIIGYARVSTQEQNLDAQIDALQTAGADRLARSLKDLLEIVDAINASGAGFKSVAEDIDTTTPAGRLVFHVFGSIEKFERERI